MYEGFWWSHMGWLLDDRATQQRVFDTSNAQGEGGPGALGEGGQGQGGHPRARAFARRQQAAALPKQRGVHGLADEEDAEGGEHHDRCEHPERDHDAPSPPLVE